MSNHTLASFADQVNATLRTFFLSDLMEAPAGRASLKAALLDLDARETWETEGTITLSSDLRLELSGLSRWVEFVGEYGRYAASREELRSILGWIDEVDLRAALEGVEATTSDEPIPEQQGTPVISLFESERRDELEATFQRILSRQEDRDALRDRLQPWLEGGDLPASQVSIGEMTFNLSDPYRVAYGGTLSLVAHLTREDVSLLTQIIDEVNLRAAIGIVASQAAHAPEEDPEEDPAEEATHVNSQAALRELAPHLAAFDLGQLQALSDHLDDWLSGDTTELFSAGDLSIGGDAYECQLLVGRRRFWISISVTESVREEVHKVMVERREQILDAMVEKSEEGASEATEAVYEPPARPEGIPVSMLFFDRTQPLMSIQAMMNLKGHPATPDPDPRRFAPWAETPSDMTSDEFWRTMRQIRNYNMVDLQAEIYKATRSTADNRSSLQTGLNDLVEAMAERGQIPVQRERSEYYFHNELFN